MTLARRMLLASGVLALIVAAAFAALILAVDAQRDATVREARSREVTAAALRLEKLVVEVETGVRGYAITRDELYLDPYTSASERDPSRRPRRSSASSPTTRLSGSGRSAGPEGPRVPRLRTDARQPRARRARPSATPLSWCQEGTNYTDEIREHVDDFLEAENQLAMAAAADADRTARLAVIVGAIGIGASTALIMLFGVYLARTVGGAVRSVADGAGRLAAGESSLRLAEEGPGEIGELTRSFNEMAERLEQNRAELEQQNAELRESERMKTELINIVSHELRTPLASVLGFTALLLKREFDPAARRHYLGIVDAQARRLAALLEDFLDVQRIEHQGLELSAESVDLASLLDEQAQLYAAQSPKHRLEVALEERPLPVHGDANRLAQVVGNLLSNAIKYSPEGGVVELAAVRHDGEVRLSVRDEGLGIPSDQQQRIFTKFFRGDAGATGITGTGLGLAVSREIVEAHGGRIGFDSDPGEGSTFWVELPEAREERGVTTMKKGAT